MTCRALVHCAGPVLARRLDIRAMSERDTPCKRVLTISKGWTTRVEMMPALKPAKLSTREGESPGFACLPSIGGYTRGMVDCTRLESPSSGSEDDGGDMAV